MTLPESEKTIYEKVGFPGLVDVVWHATPLPIRLVALPYGIVTYHTLLQRHSLSGLHSAHSRMYQRSILFKLFRPRFQVAESILRHKYGIE